MSNGAFSNGFYFAEIQEEVSAKVLEFLESPCVTRDVVLTDKKVLLLL
jgi:protein DEK